MVRIIFGLIFQGIGYGSLYGMSQAKGSDFIPFLIFGALASIGGLIMFLLGLKFFFLDDLLIELKNIREEIKHEKL